MEDIKDKIKKEKVKITTVVYSVIIVIIGCMILVGILIYGFGVNNKITKISVKYIPYPAVIIDSKNFVTIGEFSSNLKSIKSFYENQDFSQIGLRIDFSTKEGKKRMKIQERQLLNKMIEDKVIEELVRQSGVKITNEIVDQKVLRKLDKYGDKQSVEENLANFYGWTIEDFKKKIVKADLYKEELEKIFESQDNSGDELKSKIEDAKRELESKKDFSDVARDYSDGSTAQGGGELGWVAKEQLIPGLAESVFNIKEGERSGIIESELGFHIIKVEEKKLEEDVEIVKIRQIFVRKRNIADWLEEEISDMKIYIPLKDYYWDKNVLEAQFKNENLRKFEKEIIKEFQGDASLIY